jgi:hypothetical protein
MKTIRRRYVLLVATGMLLLVVCAGCETTNGKPDQAVVTAGGPRATEEESTTVTVPLPPPPPVAKPQEPPYVVHTVKWRGESMSTIAAWYTGSSRNWKLLAQENRQIKNPNAITEGDTIRIPERLLKTRDPMTKEFVDGLLSKQSKRGSGRNEASVVKDDAPTLFGPK